MKMFMDIFSGATLASDAYPHEECFNGAAIKFTAKFVTKKDDLSGIPAGEGDEEHADAEGETVIDMVDTYNMHTVEGYTPKEWLAMVKPVMGKIMKRVKDEGKLDEDGMKAYKKGCVEFVNFIKNNFSDIQIYQGEIGDYAGEEQCFAYARSENEEDPLELSFYYFKDALKEEKY